MTTGPDNSPENGNHYYINHHSHPPNLSESHPPSKNALKNLTVTLWGELTTFSCKLRPKIFLHPGEVHPLATRMSFGGSFAQHAVRGA